MGEVVTRRTPHPPGYLSCPDNLPALFQLRRGSCKVCGKEFESESAVQAHCSRDCYLVSKKVSDRRRKRRQTAYAKVIAKLNAKSK
jgi:hypothetical protein